MKKKLNRADLRAMRRATRRRPKLWKLKAGERKRITRRQERAAALRRYLLATLGGGARTKVDGPKHPRDQYWYAVGRMGGRFLLRPPSHGGGSWYARYLAMHTAGAKAREKAAA